MQVDTVVTVTFLLVQAAPASAAHAAAQLVQVGTGISGGCRAPLACGLAASTPW